MCSAELQPFLCSSPTQGIFFLSHESDILLPAFLSLILTPTSPAMWSLCFQHSRSSQAWAVPGDLVLGGIQVLLSHTRLLSTSRWSSRCMSLHPGIAHPPAQDLHSSFSPQEWDCSQLFWQYLSPSLPSRDRIHHCSNPQLWSGFKVSQGKFLHPLVPKLLGICHTKCVPFLYLLLPST